jgi:hypothetical protein
MPVATNIADKPCDAGGDVAKCQQAVHGSNIKRIDCLAKTEYPN